MSGLGVSLAQDAEPDRTISIRGDSELRAHATRGTGTAPDPYFISHLEISARNGEGIRLEGTRAHVIFEAITITSGGATHAGFHLVDVRNVTIRDSEFNSNRVGIDVERSRDVHLERNTIKTSRVGIALAVTTAATLDDNRLVVNDRDISFAGSEHNVLRRNNLSIAAGGVGIFFADEFSLDNQVDRSNVVNAIPIQWHVGTGGTAEAPLVVDNAHVALRGITNMGQIILYRASHVVLDAPRTTDGDAHGIFIKRSTNITLRQPITEGNAKAGVRIDEAAGVRVESGESRGNVWGIDATRSAHLEILDTLIDRNSATGIRTDAAGNADIHGTKVTSNGGEGIAFRNGSGTLHNNTVTGNARAGIALTAPTAATDLRDNTVRANMGAGIHLTQATAMNVTSNDVGAHSQGIRLTRSANNTFASNLIEPLSKGVGWHFDDEASYRNDIATSNLVGDQTTHWYVGLHGVNATPARVEAMRVDTHRISNVAQAAIIDSTNVTLTTPDVRGGVAAGILVLDSARMRIVDGTMTLNAGAGIRSRDSTALRIDGGSITRNGGVGLDVTRGANVGIHNATVAENALGGVRAEQVQGVTIRDNVMRANVGGVELVDLTAPDIVANQFRKNGVFGLRLTLVKNGSAINNFFDDHARAIDLVKTTGVTFRDDRMLGRNGQFGFHLDIDSLANHVGPTNRFNAVPIHWYHGVRASAAAPFVIESAKVTSPGSMNVGHILLHDVRNVTVAHADLANSTGDGIVILKSHEVSILNATINNATGRGIRISDTVGRIDGARVTSSGSDGISLERANIDIARANVTGSRDVGLRGLSGSVTVAQSTFTSNRGAGITFVATAGVSGSTIDNVTLTGNKLHGIGVEGRAWFSHIANATISDHGGAGILVDASTVGIIRDVRIANTTDGIRIRGADVPTTTRVALNATGERGVHYSDVDTRAELIEASIANATRAVQITRSPLVELRHARILIDHRDVALYVDDEASYSVRAGPTNLVNGAPMHWYSGIANTALSNIRSTLPGMSNVAQIMLHDATNVTLTSPEARDGMLDGLVIHKSQDVRVEQAATRGNLGAGIAVRASTNVTIARPTSDGDRESGILLTGGDRLVVHNATLTENGRHGILVEKATRVRIEDLTAVDTNGTGVALVDAEGAILRGATLRGASEVGVGLVGSNDARLERNTIDGAGIGIRFERTTFARLDANTITKPASSTGLYFADDKSYDNEIPLSNRVNGNVVHWYTKLSGTESAPITLGAIRMEESGITNIAQVMIYRSAYVDIPRAIATNGTSVGILLHGSSSITVRNATVTGNAVGIALRETRSSNIWDTNATGDSIGVQLTTSSDNIVARTLADNATTGVVLDRGSVANIAFGTRASHTARPVTDPSVVGMEGANLIVDAGPDLRNGEGRPVSFHGATTTARFLTERIIRQTWTFGDGATLTSDADAVFRPDHIYADAGSYTATLRVETANARTYSDETRVTIVGPLGAPQAVRATEGGGIVEVVWKSPRSDGGTPILSYRLYRSVGKTDPILLKELPVLQYYKDPTPSQPGEIRYAVAAVNADGEGPRSAWAIMLDGAAPDAPQDFSAVPGAGNVTLSWGTPSDDAGLLVTGYDIFRHEDDEPPERIQRLSNVTTWIDHDVEDGVGLTYSVAAVNAIGAGAQSANVRVTPTGLPPPPTGVLGLAGNGRATLVWTAPTTHPDAPVISYRIYRGESADNMRLVAQLPATQLLHRDARLSNAAEYAYAVSTVSRVGEGSRSAITFLAPRPVDDTPPVILAVLPADGNITDEARPSFAVFFIDNELIVDAKLSVDEALVAHEESQALKIAFQPGRGLSTGFHQAEVRLKDRAGHETTYEWTLRIVTRDEYAPRLEWSATTLPGTELALGGAIEVTATVQNTGFMTSEVPATLFARGKVVDTHPLVLAPGARANVTFQYKPDSAGESLLRIGEGTAATLTVISLDDEDLPPGVVPGAEVETEEGGKFLGIPGPGVLMALAAVAIAGRLAKRRP